MRHDADTEWIRDREIERETDKYIDIHNSHSKILFRMRIRNVNYYSNLLILQNVISSN